MNFAHAERASLTLAWGTQVLSGIFVVVISTVPLLMEMDGAPLTLRRIADWLGWLGAGMLSGSLLLTVREPLVERCFGGLERMYRWHHVLGIAACILLVAHPAILTAAMLPISPHRAWSLLSPGRWFPSNALGWLALCGLVLGLVVSLAWRSRYATWRRFHFLLGIAVLLGLAHIFFYRGLSGGFVTAAAPAILALGWRMLRADRGSGAKPYEVSSVKQIASRTTEMILRPLATRLEAAPGQFVMAAFFRGPHYRGCGEFHPYTVCESREDGALVLAIKALGDCTTRIQSMEPGVAARVQGPYGQFLAHGSQVPALWIAGGIGITPFIAMLKAGELKQPTDLIYAYRSTDGAAYLHELQEHAAHQPLLKLRTTIAQDDPGEVLAVLDEVQGLHRREVYMCGPRLLTKAIAEELRRRGIHRSQIHLEEFAFS